MLFQEVRLRGVRAAVLWGYGTAAALRTWVVTMQNKQWTVTATVERVDPFQIKRSPLLFTAPRQGGFWCWPVLKDSIQISGQQLTAKLGPPEQ